MVFSTEMLHYNPPPPPVSRQLSMWQHVRAPPVKPFESWVYLKSLGAPVVSFLLFSRYKNSCLHVGVRLKVERYTLSSRPTDIFWGGVLGERCSNSEVGQHKTVDFCKSCPHVSDVTRSVMWGSDVVARLGGAVWRQWMLSCGLSVTRSSFEAEALIVNSGSALMWVSTLEVGVLWLKGVSNSVCCVHVFLVPHKPNGWDCMEDLFVRHFQRSLSSPS